MDPATADWMNIFDMASDMRCIAIFMKNHFIAGPVWTFMHSPNW
jgi:hypothetical protein